MNDKSGRLDFLDIAKGIGILFVVLGHIYAFNPNIKNGLFVVWIYSFHMPLFFIISGMLLKYKKIDESIVKFIFKRVKGLLVPYFVFSIFTIAVLLFTEGASMSMLIFYIKRTVVGIGIDTLWFLPTLFFGECIFILVKKVLKNDWLIILTSSLIYVLGNFLTNYDGMIIVFLVRIFITIGFITVGYYGFELIKWKDIPVFVLIIILIAQIIMSKINSLVDLNNIILNNVVLYAINSILGSYIILEISKKIKLNELVYFGKNSLIIMVVHLNLIYLFRKYVKLDVFNYVGGMFLFCLILMIMPGIIYIINKHFPYFLGKFKITKERIALLENGKKLISRKLRKVGGK